MATSPTRPRSTDPHPLTEADYPRPLTWADWRRMEESNKKIELWFGKVIAAPSPARHGKGVCPACPASSARSSVA
jgi:hypothetical protein